QPPAVVGVLHDQSPASREADDPPAGAGGADGPVRFRQLWLHAVFPGARLRAQSDTQQPWAGGGAMSFRNVSIATRYRVLAVVTGLIVLAGCSGGGSNNT